MGSECASSVSIGDCCVKSTSNLMRGRLEWRHMNLKAVIEDFAAHIQSLLRGQAEERAKAEILVAFGLGAPRKPDRPGKAISAVESSAKPVPAKARRPLPPQYCPVPYCRNLAAPALGMVCSRHRDVPKTLIKKYREARRAKKDGVKPATRAPTRRAGRLVKKTMRAMAVAKKKKAPTKRGAPAAKREPKRRRATTKKRAETTGPITKETAPGAPPAVTAA